MLIQLLPLTCGALLGVAAGGSLTGLSRRVAWWQLGVASIAAQLVIARIPVSQVPWLAANGHWVWAIALAAVVLVLARNVILESGIRRFPWLIASIGVGLNLLVITANGGYMPVSETALVETGQSTQLAARGAFRRDVAVDASTRLPLLADILVDPAWLPNPLVASYGDRLLSIGLASWAFVSVYASRRRSGRALCASEA
jgi:hypothetical protein